MPWECFNCGNFNDDQVDGNCIKCEMDKATAMTMDVKVRKTQCPECQHTHMWGISCHAFTEAADDDDDDDEEEDEDEDDDEDDDDDDLLGENVVDNEPNFDKKVEASGEMQTPKLVKKMGYTRCNCDFGVPISKRYERVPRSIMVGTIKIKQKDDVLRAYAEDADKGRNKKLLSKEEEEALEHFAEKKIKDRYLDILPQVLDYLAPYECNKTAMANLTFCQAAGSFAPYTDMRDMAPWTSYRPHYGAVDSLYMQGAKVYSGGDKRILCSDSHKGETLALITRDSGAIAKLTHKDGEVYASSSNGSVRSYILSHNPSRIKLNKTYWDHSRRVNAVMFGLPSIGPCRLHGIMDHVCYLYTSSEDRYFKVWNLDKSKLVASVSNPQLRRTSIQCMSQSERHLFCGTTGSNICVFTKFDDCERDDIHACSTPGATKSYCLQITLKLPPMLMPSETVTPVTVVKCCGPNYSFSHLWCADKMGQMTVWFTPDTGIEFLPCKTWRAHTGAVNAMETTWKHMVTAADDGVILLYELGTLLLQRKIDTYEWCKEIFPRPEIRRRLKSMYIQEAVYEDEEDRGQMVVGTSYGDVIVMDIGREV